MSDTLNHLLSRVSLLLLLLTLTAVYFSKNSNRSLKTHVLSTLMESVQLSQLASRLMIVVTMRKFSCHYYLILAAGHNETIHLLLLLKEKGREIYLRNGKVLQLFISNH